MLLKPGCSRRGTVNLSIAAAAAGPSMDAGYCICSEHCFVWSGLALHVLNEELRVSTP